MYIMTNNSGTLYVGVTNKLERRVYEHKQGVHSGFTKRYKLTRLVYYESTPDVREAIQREKAIKGWVRRKKITLIALMNPYWKDLSELWIAEGRDPSPPLADQGDRQNVGEATAGRRPYLRWRPAGVGGNK